MQMPNVFVHPPEEDQEEPYCCFDAANPSRLSITPADVQIFHPFNDTPSSSTRSVIDAYQNNHHAHQEQSHDDLYDDDLDHDLRNDPHFFASQFRRSPQPPPPEDDSDVIEVVRVRKSKPTLNEDTRPPSAPLKRSSTFKSKASKAFRSLTGSLRGPKVSRTPEDERHVQQEQEIPPSPTVSRRGSLVLTQLFSSNTPSSTSLKSHTSVSSFDTADDLPQIDPITSPTSSAFPTDTAISPPSSRRSSLYTETIPQEILQLRSPSPAPSTASNRKFSRLNLRKMFSFSSASTSSSSGRTTPTLTSSSGPQTPTSTDSVDPPNDITPRASRVIRHHPLAIDPLDAPITFDFAESSSAIIDTSSTPTPKPSDADVSFEMRLDSLHFDDLSFDAERFIVS